MTDQESINARFANAPNLVLQVTKRMGSYFLFDLVRQDQGEDVLLGTYSSYPELPMLTSFESAYGPGVLLIRVGGLSLQLSRDSEAELAQFLGVKIAVGSVDEEN